MRKDVELRLLLLEKRVALLKKENESISKILLEKVKPVCDDWVQKKDFEENETERVVYG